MIQVLKSLTLNLEIASGPKLEWVQYILGEIDCTDGNFEEKKENKKRKRKGKEMKKDGSKKKRTREIRKRKKKKGKTKVRILSIFF